MSQKDSAGKDSDPWVEMGQNASTARAAGSSGCAPQGDALDRHKGLREPSAAAVCGFPRVRVARDLRPWVAGRDPLTDPSPEGQEESR